MRGDVNFGNNIAGTTWATKTYSPGHNAANRGGNVRFGMQDGSFAGMSVTTLQGSNSNFNSQNVALLTHNGAVVGDFPSVFAKYDGQVGIGTTDPVGTLTVRGPNAGNITFEDHTTTSILNLIGRDHNVRLQMGVGNGGLGFAGWIQASYDNTPGSAGGDGNSGSEPLLINPRGGNVGIATTNPLSAFHVNGMSRVDGYTSTTGVTYLSRVGYKETYRFTTGKYRFAFGTGDFYGAIIITGTGTNYSQGTNQERFGRWVITLRYQTNRTLTNLHALGAVYTNTYNTNGLGLIWTNVDNNNSDLLIYNSSSSGAEDGCYIDVEFIAPSNQTLLGVVSRTQYFGGPYTTNPYT